MRHLTLRAACRLALNDEWSTMPEGVSACGVELGRAATVAQHYNVTATESPSSSPPDCPQCFPLYSALLRVRSERWEEESRAQP